mmetsp:Transcript_21077/g.45813  ORF Transcript_21077/g.45813 Transcript_21077/m.45813 type:complete len:178 (-) Transcript_21077:214-747(-)
MAVIERTISDSSPVSVMRWSDESAPNKGGGKKKRSSGKSIVFAESVEIFDVPHLNDTPDEEIYATWYSKEEYSAIKSSYQLTISMMESGGCSAGQEDHTPRGLEYRTQEGAWARYENKRDAYDSVLDEQDRQWKLDADDEEKLREAYVLFSEKCAKKAHKMGVKDQEDATEIHKADS